jgi:hypothetical protein
VLEYFPASQSVHALASAAEYVPTPHVRHAVLAAPGEYLPAGHMSHTWVTVLATLPVPHDVHADDPACATVPAEHGVHDVAA